jgi:hypothetical protein
MVSIMGSRISGSCPDVSQKNCSDSENDSLEVLFITRDPEVSESFPVSMGPIETLYQGDTTSGRLKVS